MIHRLTILVLILAFVVPVQARQELTVADVVSRHLSSIGSEKARGAAGTRVIFGKASVSVRGIRGTPDSAEGKAVLASVDRQTLLGMAFELSNYRQESVAYNGKSVTAATSSPGHRTPLGEFMLSNEAVLGQNLFGGVLTAGWRLANPDLAGLKLEYNGIAKRDGAKMHEVRVVPKGGSDVRVKLFFDVETFRHVRSEYLLELPAAMGSSPDQSAKQRSSRYMLVEKFSDFREEAGLMLPHQYSFDYEIDNSGDRATFKWVVTFEVFRFNEPFDQKSFTLS